MPQDCTAEGGGATWFSYTFLDAPDVRKFRARCAGPSPSRKGAGMIQEPRQGKLTD